MTRAVSAEVPFKRKGQTVAVKKSLGHLNRKGAGTLLPPVLQLVSGVSNWQKTEKKVKNYAKNKPQQKRALTTRQANGAVLHIKGVVTKVHWTGQRQRNPSREEDRPVDVNAHQLITTGVTT